MLNEKRFLGHKFQNTMFSELLGRTDKTVVDLIIANLQIANKWTPFITLGPALPAIKGKRDQVLMSFGKGQLNKYKCGGWGKAISSGQAGSLLSQLIVGPGGAVVAWQPRTVNKGSSLPGWTFLPCSWDGRQVLLHLTPRIDTPLSVRVHIGKADGPSNTQPKNNGWIPFHSFSTIFLNMKLV